MGLLSALNLPPPPSRPPGPAAAPVARERRVGPGFAAPATPYTAAQTDEDIPPAKVRTSRPDSDAPMPAVAKDTARGNDESSAATGNGHGGEQGEATPVPDPRGSADVSAGRPVRVAAKDVEGKVAAAKKPSTSDEGGMGDFSIALKESADGTSVAIKLEHKEYIAGENFKVWVLPCFVYADVGIGIEGEVAIDNAAKRTVTVKGFGAGALGIGRTSRTFRAGARGAFQLSGSTAIPATLNQARQFEADPFSIEILGEGKVGLMIEVDKGPSRAFDVDVCKWQLFIVHVGVCANGLLGPVRVTYGRDLRRLMDALSNLGSAICEQVEKYAEKAVDAAAEWVDESPIAKKIDEGTGEVLKKVKEKTGRDVGKDVEDATRFVLGGESADDEARGRKAANEARNDSNAEWMAAVQACGLGPGGEFQSRTQADFDEFNKIADVHSREGGPKMLGGTPVGAWRPMLDALVAKRRARKEEQARAEAARKQQAKDRDADAAAVLAARLKDADNRMNAALAAANRVGNPLNNKTQGQPGSKARKYWETGMIKFWNPGSAARLKAATLQGEAKIAKAEEATALLLKARAVFQEGTRFLE